MKVRGSVKKINNLEIFQTKSLDSNAPKKDESSLDTNLANIDSSLDLSLQNKNTKRTDLGKLSPTSSKDKSALDTQGYQSSATTLHPGQDNQEYPDSQSVSGRMPDNTSFMESGTEENRTKGSVSESQPIDKNIGTRVPEYLSFPRQPTKISLPSKKSPGN